VTSAPAETAKAKSRRGDSYVIDASVLVGAVNSADVNHVACYSFFKNHEDATFVIPTIAYFEFQAAQSRIRRERRKAIRELYMPNAETYEITAATLRRAAELQLPDKLSTLRGADLVYACIAAIENLPLVTNDQGFRAVEPHVRIVWV
jgi:predicted nucleic acid-binding protein